MLNLNLNWVSEAIKSLKDWWPVVKENFRQIQDKHNALESRVDTIITTPIDGQAAAQELVDARGGKPTLGARLDEVDSQLAENNTELENLTLQITNMSSSKADKTELQTVSSIAVDAQTKANNPLGQIGDNTIPATKLKQSPDADKIKLAHLSQEVRDAIAGATTIGTTPAPGSVTETELADGGVTSKKVTAAAYGKPYIMPGLVLPNYDTATRTLHFNSDEVYKCMLFYKNTVYQIPVGTTVIDENTTTAVQLIFNTDSNTFSFIPYTQALAENELRIGVYKRYPDFYQWDFPCAITVDGILSDTYNTSLAKWANSHVLINSPNYARIKQKISDAKVAFALSDDSAYIAIRPSHTTAYYYSITWAEMKSLFADRIVTYESCDYISISDSEALIYNYNSNTLEIIPAHYVKPFVNVLILLCYGGYVKGGWALDWINDCKVGYITGSYPFNVDFVNYKIVFPNFAGSDYNVIWGNSWYRISPGTEIDITVPTGSDRLAIYFNTATKTFITRTTAQIPYAENCEILIGSIWKSGNRAYLFGNYTINGVSPYRNDAKIVKDYFEEEGKITINTVNNICTNKALVFTVLTDTHYPGEALYNWFIDTASNIKYVNNRIKSDAIIHLGDMINGNKTKDESQTLLNEAFGMLRESNIPLFTCFGNHDDNSYGDNSSLTDLITYPYWYGIVGRQNEYLVERPENKAYYYVDYPKHKIRIIFLNAIDYTIQDDGNGNAVYNGANWWGYGQDQLVWLGEEALNTPDGYGVLVFSHMPTRAELNYNGVGVYNGDIVEAILQAYTSHTTYTYTVASKTFDFTAKAGTEVITFAYGHTHGDSVRTAEGISFPFISIACNVPGQISEEYLPDGSVAPAREIGTVTQDLWDVMVLRRDERKIYMVRFGAGEDRVISY